MSRISPLTLIPALIVSLSHASEITVEKRPFSIEKSFTGYASPQADKLFLIKIEPEAWNDFTLKFIELHGAQVKKGDRLVEFAPETLDDKIKDMRHALANTKLELAGAELNADQLKLTAPLKLEAIRRAAQIAKEEHAYFTNIRRKATEETASQRLKRNEQILSNQREELKQLSKMYEADDLTDNTEEIILIRQQDAVAGAEFALRMEILDHKRNLEVSLPREAKQLADAERDSALTLKKAEIDIPRSLEVNALELQATRTKHENTQETLAQLEADRAQFLIKAPADGTFYHGPIVNGRWQPDDTSKTLVPHGKPAHYKAFATFISKDTPYLFTSQLDEETARSLSPSAAGIATLAGREDLEIKVKLEKLATIPAPDGSFRADFSLKWPKDTPPTLGTTAEIRLITYQQSSAIAIPTKALTYGLQGWTVTVKMADAKVEQRLIQRGRSSKEMTEILSGLEVGQVVVVP